VGGGRHGGAVGRCYVAGPARGARDRRGAGPGVRPCGWGAVRRPGGNGAVPGGARGGARGG